MYNDLYNKINNKTLNNKTLNNKTNNNKTIIIKD